MALYRCTSGSGGGMTETTLWTNPDSTTGFSSQSVSISPYKLNDFDYIKIEYQGSINSISGIKSIMFEPSALLNGNSNAMYSDIVLGAQVAQSTEYYARKTYALAIDATQIYFTNSTKVGSSSVVNNAIIPIKIYGVKL